MRNCTKTKDEQSDPDQEPFRPFPSWWFMPRIMQVMDFEPLVFLKKSRTMMMTWLACAYASHMAFTRPATNVVFQSRDEKRSTHCVECCKILWEQSLKPLRDRWTTPKWVWEQPYNRFTLNNRSSMVALPQDPDQIRFAHPTMIVLDEAAFIEKGEESFNTAVATRVPKMFVLSSAKVGWFEDLYHASRPASWPDYDEPGEGKITYVGETA